MGLQALLTVAKDTSVAGLATAGLRPTGEDVATEEAVARGLRGRMSAVEVAGHVLVIGGVDPDHDLPRELAEALGTEVVSARFMSAVGYFTWTVHHADGADGTAGVRTLECGEGEVVVDEGAPLPEETRPGPLDAGTLRALLAARTGIGPEDWQGRTAQVLERTPSRRRRGLFRRRR